MLSFPKGVSVLLWWSFLRVHKVYLSSLGSTAGTSVCYVSLSAKTVDTIIAELE